MALTREGTSRRFHGRAWRMDAASKRVGWLTMIDRDRVGVVESERVVGDVS
jgi:hypothetical protein